MSRMLSLRLIHAMHALTSMYENDAKRNGLNLSPPIDNPRPFGVFHNWVHWGTIHSPHISEIIGLIFKVQRVFESLGKDCGEIQILMTSGSPVRQLGHRSGKSQNILISDEEGWCVNNLVRHKQTQSIDVNLFL